MEENNKTVPMRYLNVPLTLFRNSLYIASITAVKTMLQSMKYVTEEEELLKTLDKLLRYNDNILKGLRNRYVRIYGPATDKYNQYNSFVEYVGKFKAEEHPGLLEITFKGISIHRVASTADILFIDFVQIKTSLLDEKVFLYKTLQMSDERDYISVINNLIL